MTRNKKRFPEKKGNTWLTLAITKWDILGLKSVESFGTRKAKNSVL